jgi:hypothetical protein
VKRKVLSILTRITLRTQGNEIPFPREKYYLCIGNQEWLSNDLSELEEILFEFAESNYAENRD